MGLIENIRGLMGLQGPPGQNGVVGLFVASWAKKTWVVLKPTPSLTLNAAAGTVTVNSAGWYVMNWSGAINQAQGSTIVLSAQGGLCVIAGPLT